MAEEKVKDDVVVQEKEVVGRSFGSTTLATKESDGSWKVIVNIVERRQLKDAEWEDKLIEAQCTDDDFNKAYEVAMTAALMKFDDAIGETGNSLFD